MLEDHSRQVGVYAAGLPRIVQLLQEHLQRDHAKVASLARPIVPHCGSYMELTSDATSAVGVVTRGRGAQLTAQLLELLRRCGIERTAQEQMLVLAQALDHPRCLLELTLASPGCEPQIGVRFRRSMHIDHALRLIGADAAMALELHGFTTLLARTTVSAITLTASADAAVVRHTVHLTQIATARRREQLRMRIAHALSRYATSGAAVSCWAEHHDALLASERTLLTLSFTPSSNGSPAHVGIEYANVLPEAAAQLAGSRAAVVYERLAQLCLRADRSALSYLSVGLGTTSVPELRGYACVS